MSAENLAALGAERLAALLMELGEADPAVRKRLVLAVAERGGPASLIKAVDRRLSALANSYGEVQWERERAYAAEIDGLRGVITQTLAPVDAVAAVERLLRLIRLAPGVFQRVDDSNGRFDGIFRTAVADLGAVWGLIADREPEDIAGEVLALAGSDDYRLCDDLVELAAPALGPVGLAALARLAEAALADLGDRVPTRGDSGARLRLLRLLSDVADASGDVDGFIAIQTKAGDSHVHAVEIAQRLNGAGRAAEALDWLDKTSGGSRADAWERDAQRIVALEQLKRRPEAQTVRWRLFEETLSGDVLRAYLRALSDFEEDAALHRAFTHVAAYPDAARALRFLTSWPNPAAAAKLVLDRGIELDGRDFPILNAAAEVLSDAYPLAAMLLRRRMIDSVLDRAASAAYVHAASNLATCAALESDIDGSGSTWPSHADYLADLRSRHGRKSGFWSLVKP